MTPDQYGPGDWTAHEIAGVLDLGIMDKAEIDPQRLEAVAER